MSISTVQEAVLSSFRADASLQEELSTIINGTVSSTGVNVVGIGTSFSSLLAEGDYIGNTNIGYRKVASIADDSNLVLKSAFDDDLVDASLIMTHIQRGMPKMMDITRLGRLAKVAFVSSAEVDDNVPGARVMVVYGFSVVVAFSEQDVDESEVRKSDYDRMFKNVIDKDPTFGGTVIGNTAAGTMKFMDSPDGSGIFFGVMPLVVSRKETRGDR